MKKTDIAMIFLIASVSVMVAYFLTGFILGEGSTEAVKVPKIDAIVTEVSPPDPNIFNESAINPAVEVKINSGED